MIIPDSPHFINLSYANIVWMPLLPVFVSLLDLKHLYICLLLNVRVLPWDFCKLNI